MVPCSSQTRKFWFSFGDCSVAVLEHLPVNGLYSGTLFFVHGRYGEAHLWEPVANLLSSRYRCVALDLPGFGSSFSVRGRGLSLQEHSALVCRVLDRMMKAGEKPVLVGHDVGGAVAQMSAVKFPDTLGGLVLLNSCLIERPSALRCGWMGWRVRLALLRLSLFEWKGKPEFFFVWNRLLEPWSHFETRASLIRALRAIEKSWPGQEERRYWTSGLESLACPILVLHGAKDRIHSSGEALEFVQRLADGEYLELEESGHCLNLENPEWVALKIREFAFRIASEREISLFRKSPLQ